jgi:pyruvate-formate lyase-activating enzyme
MNICHITHSPEDRHLFLHFWGCNFKCHGCIRRKDIRDTHLKEAHQQLFDRQPNHDEKPACFLDMTELQQYLQGKDFSRVTFMGMEPTLDPDLTTVAAWLHENFATHNVLLTNGHKTVPLAHFDEVVVSIKAMDDAIHLAYTGVSNQNTLNNFVRYHKSGIKLRAESVYIPEYIDNREIKRIAEFIAGVNENIPYRIDAFVPFGDTSWRRPAFEEMDDAVALASRYLNTVSCLKGCENVKNEVTRVY